MAVFDVIDQGGEAPDRIFARPQVAGAHIGPAATKRCDHRYTAIEGLVLKDLGQRVLERAVASVDDEDVDFLAGEIGKRLGDHVRRIGFRVDDIGMATQEAEQSLDLCIIPPSPEVI